MAASDGGVFALGDAALYGSLGGIHLNQPVVGVSPTPDGKGLLAFAKDGGVFNFGEAGFFSSLGGTRLNAPVVGATGTGSNGVAPNGSSARVRTRATGQPGAVELRQSERRR